MHKKGHEMPPGFSRIFSELSGTQVKNVSDLVRFNEMHPYRTSNSGLYVRLTPIS